jgi:hypothetical protein
VGAVSSSLDRAEKALTICAPVDTGSLREGGRKQQPGTALYNQPMTASQAQNLLKQPA